MPPCPISLDRLFMLVGAFEGLSLWGAIDQFPKPAKRAASIRWKLVSGEWPVSKITREAFSMLRNLILFTIFYPVVAFLVRCLKWTPALVTTAALVFYSLYPVFTNQSASIVFYNNWKICCFGIALYALCRLLIFYFAHWYLIMFEQVYKKTFSVKVVDPSPDEFSIDL